MEDWLLELVAPPTYSKVARGEKQYCKGVCATPLLRLSHGNLRQ